MGNRIGQDRPDGHSGKGCNAAEGADEEKLLPDGDPNIGMDFCSDLSSLQHAMQPFYARTRSPGQLSENDPPRPGRLRYDPRCFNCRNDVGDSAEPRVVSCYPGYALSVLYPVLQRKDHSVRADQWTNTLRCGVGVVGLNTEEDQIDRTYIVGVSVARTGSVKSPASRDFNLTK